MHSWPTYPVGSGGSYLDYARAARTIALAEKAGDSVVYQAQQDEVRSLAIGYGVQYYLAADHVPLPRQLFIAETGVQAGSLYPVPCQNPAACLGRPARIWIVGSGDLENPYQAITPKQAALLRPRYRLSYRKHVPGLTVFLLTRTAPPARVR